MHLKSVDPTYISVLEKGPHVPMKLVPAITVGGVTTDEHWIPKPQKEFSEADREEISKDAKVTAILYNAFDNNLLYTLMDEETAKEIWDAVKVMYEGTDMVRKNRMELLVQQYEMFAARPSEGISEIYDRFVKLINELKVYGGDVEYHLSSVNSRFLRSLPRVWESKTTPLRMQRNIDSVPIEEIYGELKTYEMEIKQSDTLEKMQTKETTIALMRDKWISYLLRALYSGLNR